MQRCPASFAILTIALAGTVANAQIAGVLRGRVLDGSGSGVPNAQVELTQSSTSLHQETTSTATGDYVFSNLAPGSQGPAGSTRSGPEVTP